MTNKMRANAKKAIGYLEEEAGEIAASDKIAQSGRNLRNEGRAEQGETPLTGKPGTGTNKYR